MQYHKITVNGLEIFYRESGAADLDSLTEPEE